MSKTLKLTPVVRAVGLLWFFAGLIMLASQVANAQEVLYRVNAGGSTVAAIDGGMAWGADTNANKSPYLDSVYAGAGGGAAQEQQSAHQHAGRLRACSEHAGHAISARNAGTRPPVCPWLSLSCRARCQL